MVPGRNSVEWLNDELHIQPLVSVFTKKQAFYSVKSKKLITLTFPAKEKGSSKIEVGPSRYVQTGNPIHEY